MELIILVALLVFVFWWFSSSEKHAEESGRHPLDGATRKEPDLTTVADGIGHESVPAVMQALDINKDGKVNAKDVQAAVDIVADNAKAVIKKPRKPRAPKPPQP